MEELDEDETEEDPVEVASEISSETRGGLIFDSDEESVYEADDAGLDEETDDN